MSSIRLEQGPTKKQSKTSSDAPPTEDYPSTRYFQIHFQHLYELIESLKEQVQEANRQIAAQQQSLLSLMPDEHAASCIKAPIPDSPPPPLRDSAEETDKATAIKHIHISDRGHFGKTRLSADEQGVEALGYVIVARDIEQHIADLTEKTDTVCLYQTRVAGLMSGRDAVNVSLKQHDGSSLNVSAQLLVGADGGNSTVRKLLEIPQQVTEYGQTALVTTVQSALPHRNTAFERFTEFGPLALLPVAGKQSAVVWTRSHEQAETLINVSEREFTAELQSCFGYRLGELKPVAPRRAFPLSLIRAESMVSGRTVIIGNAVHQLHPVAGQGFNLGIRDVALLAEMLSDQQARQGDLGDPALLNQYSRQRQQDHGKTIGFTNGLVKLFSNANLPLAAARNAGLTLLDHLPFAKQILTRHAMGLAERLPKLGDRE